MKKVSISHFLRKTKLLYWADFLRFYIMKYKNRGINNDFKIKNPSISLPPDYLIYESFQINYLKYYTESFETASELTGQFSKYKELKDLKILDWGCGPGRIIRHLPKLIQNNCEFYATDYNEKSIMWCFKNLKGINFNKNSLSENLEYPGQYFDIIYGISIFTHLSEKMHYKWFYELFRILKPGGILYLTTQGNGYKSKLSNKEKQKFESGKLVVRGNVREGHRTYSAFHPPQFMHKLFSNLKILNHIVDEADNGKWIPQDIWILSKQY